MTSALGSKKESKKANSDKQQFFLRVVNTKANYLLIISSLSGSLLLLFTFTERDDLSSKPIATVQLLPSACSAGLGQVLVIFSF